MENSNIYLGLGSNIGNRKENIEKAVSFFNVLNKSSLYETEPVGYEDQPWFLNSVIKIKTQLSVLELFKFVKDIEKNMGREKTVKDGPRIIDIDILFYGNEIINLEELKVPHPRLHERLFVLEPLAEICNIIHPILKKEVNTLLEELKSNKIVKKV